MKHNLSLLFLALALFLGCADSTSSSSDKDQEDSNETSENTDGDIEEDIASDGDLVEPDTKLDSETIQPDHSELSPDEAEDDGEVLPFELPEHLTHESSLDDPEHGWERIEHWSDSRELFEDEDYLSSGRNDQDDQIEDAFGSATPPSSDFLLHYAPNWDSATQPIPVLLVHGSATNADQSWANPGLWSYCGAVSCPDTGLMQDLVEQGFAVFAISYPHMHGDNRYWAEQLADAIDIIRYRLQVQQVDLVAWSKGGFAARLYAGSQNIEGGTPYRGDLRRMLLVGSPNKGLDYTFRHGILPSVGSYTACGVMANSPAAHTSLMCYGFMYTQPEVTIYVTDDGDFFPGQRQMLYRWDDVYDINTSAQDYQTTYEGGTGFVSVSLGIDAAIAQGALVEALLDSATPPELEVYQLCGGDPDIPWVNNENTGPSDGLLFIDSCFATEGLTQIVDTFEAEELNHFELGWSAPASDKIIEWLSSAAN